MVKRRKTGRVLKLKGKCYKTVKHGKGRKSYIGHVRVKCKPVVRKARKATRKPVKKGCAKKVSRAVRTIKSCGCRK